MLEPRLVGVFRTYILKNTIVFCFPVCMLGPRLVGVYVCSPMNAESDVVRADKHRKRGWSLCMYARF